MTSAIRLTGVRLGLAGRMVLNGIDLAIGAGEFIGVLGPNGAGKTTLMRAILGLIAPASGSIEVFGTPAKPGNPAIGYLPQLRGGLGAPRLRGRDFVAAACDGQRFGLPLLDRGTARAVTAALAAVGAEALADRPIAALSGGERQRLLLAQALIGHPALLLLDEPLISLDPHHQGGVVELVRSLARQLGVTVLFSAHELNPLLAALDQVLYLGSGQAALGTVDEVIRGPVLSRLYGAPIDVVRLHGRIFVMSGRHDMERDEHRHDSDTAHHDHA